MADSSRSRVFSTPSPSPQPRARRPRPSHGSQDIPEFHLRPSSFGSGISQQVEASPAYVLEWDLNGCRLVFINSVDELRTEITAGKPNGPERLFVIHGLPIEYVNALKTSLDIDPAFIEAHYGRRRYRPLRWRRDARFAHYEYPELVHGFKKADTNAKAKTNERTPERRPSRGTTYIDLMGDPPVHAISSSGDAVMFCHASLWMSSQADVLFLDRLLWRDPNSELRKSKRGASVTRPFQLRLGSPREGSNAWDVQLAEGEEIPGLEDILYETLKDAVKVGDALQDILSTLAHSHWLDFFEALPTQPEPEMRHDSALLWQVERSLEQNLDVSTFLTRQGNAVPDANHSDWQSLVDRARRRVDFSLLVIPRAATTKHAKGPKSNRASANVGNRTVSGNMSSSGVGSGSSDEDANQRSLDRVTYLGGVLLPFTVVSGILSMNSDYSPDGSSFWIFWVASIVSSAICLFIIYLDQLRGLEVWFEVTAGDAIDGLFQPAHMVVSQPAHMMVSQPVEVQTDTIVKTGLQRILDSDGQVPNLQAEDDTGVVVDMPTSSDSSDVEVLADSPFNPTLLVQRRSDGSKPKAWRRKQLGWAGAVKKVVGYYWWRGSPAMQISPPILDRFRVKTV